MPTDLQQIQTVKTQTLAVIADLTANPKPSYEIDGQRVSWNDYLTNLRQTIDWCDAKQAAYEPFEIATQATTPEA